MNILKVFFVILIAFTGQILAKPPRNQNRNRNVATKNRDPGYGSMVPAELPQGLKMNMYGGWSRKSRNY